MEKTQLTKKLKEKIFEVTKDLEEKSVGIAFSGGVDSSILAKASKDVGKNVKLLTVSFGNDRDIKFAKWVSNSLNLKLFSELVSIEDLENGLKTVLNLINFVKLVRLENCVGFYYVFKLASKHGIKTVLSANGADELFCGYHVYVSSSRKDGVENLMNSLIETAKKDKREIDKIAAIFNVDYVCPFLSEKFVDFSLSIPVKFKIKGESDKLRKNILRKAALEIGVPPSAALKPKKAFQYSSGLHKSVVKLSKQKGFTKKNAVNQGFTSGIEAFIRSLEQNQKL